ncbi:MAG TPA: 4-(cytidine 5'-diphospho)-2-C-methyl-D-erythritol kinase [Bryobacteraceae bacterium]|nr:4-(cytidine 5'-diphospho)-2-C-methyl-D-erythritol kinase [Bryobacteraceae bacterium]
MAPVRTARLRSLAKLNLSLKVLNKRPDGFHDLRTVFQTISLADTIDLEFTPGRGRRVELESGLDIPNNLIVRAANLLMDELKIRGTVRFRLTKTIPMGAGLGGGSSNAATVLLALPALAGVPADLATLTKLGASLGSDVPFFLHGGTALGIGRGTELYPLPEMPASPALVVCPGIHVSTPEAYRALGRGLTDELKPGILNTLQAFIWREGGSAPAETWKLDNDFETVVFRQFPLLGAIKRRLLKAGARSALMTGSGSAVFGVFGSPGERDRALGSFRREEVFSVKLVSRGAYQALWRRQLGDHIGGKTWPPLSRYSK